MELSNRRVLILGLAREGASLARFFARQRAEVTVTDAAPMDALAASARGLALPSVRLVVGADYPELVHEADAIFVSPGVPETNPVYQAAIERALPIQSMTTLFFALCPGSIVGVTGSSGKTTTTGLIGHIFRTADRHVVVGGNIGDPMLDLLPRIHANTIVVLELSSFQLHLLRRSPHVAVVTNVTPNHLDRHETMESYVFAKLNICSHQSAADHLVLNTADSYAPLFESSTPAQTHNFGFDSRGAQNGSTVRDGHLGLLKGGSWAPVLPEADIPLLGRHNVENVLAATAATSIFDVPAHSMAKAIRTFQPAPHRLQPVADRSGVRYVDDSIATSPARASVALQAISAPVVLIAGGRDKCLPWQELARLAVRRARAVVLIGEAADTIEHALLSALPHETGLLERGAIVRCVSLEAAVRTASDLARTGDVVLLSPACASYDMFHDFEERGAAFARAVERLRAA